MWQIANYLPVANLGLENGELLCRLCGFKDVRISLKAGVTGSDLLKFLENM